MIAYEAIALNHLATEDSSNQPLANMHKVDSPKHIEIVSGVSYADRVEVLCVR